jgi:hypothetical protein
VLERLDAEKEERKLRRREYERQRSEARRAERAERNARIVSDLNSGQYTEAEVAKCHGLSLRYLKRLAKEAA